MQDNPSLTGVITAIELLGDLGWAGVLMFILYASYKGWWVWGWQVSKNDTLWANRLDIERADKNEWKTLALQAYGIAEMGATVARQKQPEGGGGA